MEPLNKKMRMHEDDPEDISDNSTESDGSDDNVDSDGSGESSFFGLTVGELRRKYNVS